MKKFTILAICLYGLFANSMEVYAADPSKVAMLGLFHFSNPQADHVKTDQIDITSPESQQYLMSLSERISNGLKPTHVLVECLPEMQSYYDEQYQAFREGSFDLPVNEIFQIGFRVSKLSGLNGVICFDDREIEWDLTQVLNHISVYNVHTKNQFESFIKDITESFETMHSTLSLRELLIAYNSEEMDKKSKSFYLITNSVGAFGEYLGADAAASWWHRNFRMYSNIQKIAAPASRVLVIAGQGHTAILKDLLSFDRERNFFPIVELL